MSVFRYRVYQTRLRERLLNREACRAIQHAFSKPLPGELDIKRHKPGILLYQFYHCFTLQTSDYDAIIDFESI